MSRTPPTLLAVALLSSGCVTHQLIVANPNPTDDRPAAIDRDGADARNLDADADRISLRQIAVDHG